MVRITTNQKYDVWELLQIAEDVRPPDEVDEDRDYWCGDYPFTHQNGWIVYIFYDCGGLDYIAHFVNPQGEEVDFWDWPESDERSTLINWRGVGDMERIKKLS